MDLFKDPYLRQAMYCIRIVGGREMSNDIVLLIQKLTVSVCVCI